MEENKRGKRVKKQDGQNLVDRSKIEYSISASKAAKKKLRISKQAKKKISTSRTSELAARSTERKSTVRQAIWGRTDPNKPAPAKTFNGRMISGTLTGLTCFLLLLGPVTNFAKQSQNIEDLQKQVDNAQAKLTEAQNINQKWSDPEYVKQQARVRLFYTMPGETNYLAVGKMAQQNESASDGVGNPAMPSAPPQGTTNSGQNTHWYDTFMESYNKANNGN